MLYNKEVERQTLQKSFKRKELKSMEDQKDYVCKERCGRESPMLVAKMQIKVVPHPRADGPKLNSNIEFYDYAEVIGTKRYVAYKFGKYNGADALCFRFYSTLSDSPEDRKRRFKMFPLNDFNNTFAVGDPLAINVCNKKEIVAFYSELYYPLYYIPDSNEYIIKLEDGKRKPLFVGTKNIMKREKSMESNNVRSFPIDTVKFVKLLAKLGKSNAKLGRDMGYSDSAVGAAIKLGRVTPEMADRLERYFHIHKKDYEIILVNDSIEKSDAVPVKTSKIEFVIAPETEQKLYDIVNRAVYEAVKRALNE